MLRPVAMAKVAIVGPASQTAATVGTLHELGVLHIQDYAPGEAGFELGRPLPEGAHVSERLLRIRGLLKGAQIPPPAQPRRFGAEEVRGLEAALAAVEAELGRLVESRTGLLDRVKKLDEEQALLERVRNFPLPAELLSGYASVATVAGFVTADADVGAFGSVHPHCESVTSDEAEGRFVFAAAPKEAEKALQEVATRLRVQPFELATTRGIPADRLRSIEQERAALRAQVDALEAELALVREEHAASFYALDESLALRADRATAPVRFRTTPNSFMVEGWVPRDELARLRTAVQSATKNLVFVTELHTPLTQPWKTRGASPPAHAEPHHEEVQEGHGARHEAEEVPPVKLENPKGTGAYVLLTDTYSRPRYTEVDPTLFFYVGFPFFYGFMLGDIAYGALLLLLVWTGVFNRVFDFFGFQSKRQLNRIFLHCGLLSMVFGVLYAEFFGLELIGHEGVLSHYEAHLGPIPFPLSRFHEVKLLLFITIVIASLHMLFGLALGLRNAAVEHGWAESVKHRGSWFCILLAAAIAAGANLPGVLGLHGLEIRDPTLFNYAALVAFGTGLVLLVMGEGPIGLLELPTVLSNLLSYTRLVAIGLSSAGIALAGNEVAARIFEAGNVGAFIAGALVLLVFHLLNIALGIIGPALHSLRLHYVEFFTKFYEGGGDSYAPFAAKRTYTAKEVKQA